MRWIATSGAWGECDVQWLATTACIGGEASLDLGFTNPPLNTSPGMHFCLELRDRGNNAKPVFTSADGEIAELKCVVVGEGVDSDRSYLRAIRADHTSPARKTSDASVILYQRNVTESVWDFMHRIADAGDLHLAAKLKDKDIDDGMMNAACPPGWCVAIPGRLPPSAGLARVIDSTVFTGSGVAGLVRTVAHAGAYLAGVYVDETSIKDKRCIALSKGGWRVLPVSPGSTGGRRTRIQKRAMLPKPAAEAAQLFNPDVRSLTAGTDDPLPVSPVSVAVGDWYWFATAASVQIDLDVGAEGDSDDEESKSPAANVTVTLDLVEASSWTLSAGAAGATILIGCIDAEEIDDPHAIGLSPPGGDLGLGPLANWVLGGYGDEDRRPLLVFEAAAGFVRPKQSAFCARWRPGDLVLFCVDTRGTAVILGALGLPRTDEAGEPCVSIMGEVISLWTGPADGDQKKMLSVSTDQIEVAGV